MGLVGEQQSECTDLHELRARRCCGTPVVGFRFAKTEFIPREENHEHPRETYQGSAGNASPGRGVAKHPGQLLCQDTYFVGTIKGVGKIYQQTVIGGHSSHVFAKFYLSKVPMTAVDVPNDCELLFYEEYGVEIEHLLTDNGREYCGRPVRHPFELYLAIHQIRHGHRLTGNQRLLRTLPSHGEGAVIFRGVPQDVVRIAGTTAARRRCVPLLLQLPARPSGLPHAGTYALPGVLRGSRSLSNESTMYRADESGTG